VHQPVSRGLAVFADAWLSGWLAEISADLRETVRGSALEVVLHDDALYKSTTFKVIAKIKRMPFFLHHSVDHRIMLFQ